MTRIACACDGSVNRRRLACHILVIWSCAVLWRMRNRGAGRQHRRAGRGVDQTGADPVSCQYHCRGEPGRADSDDQHLPLADPQRIVHGATRHFLRSA